MGYITVTCHYITEDWVFESNVLETDHVEVEHTAANLASELKRVTEEWYIADKVTCVVTDNARSIKNAVKLQNETVYHALLIQYLKSYCHKCTQASPRFTCRRRHPVCREFFVLLPQELQSIRQAEGDSGEAQY